MKRQNNNECCPEFNPVPWEGKIFEWENKKFIRDKVFTLFYIPVNFGAVIKRMMEKAEKSGAVAMDYLCMSDHTSKWNMNLYLAVDKAVEEMTNMEISGKFFSKVYEGDFKNTGKWCSDYEAKAREKGFKIKKYYMWYTTCPVCAKKYGKNYVVVIGEVE